MAGGRKERRRINISEAKADSLWRKPIILDAFEDNDPLAPLYRGREVGESANDVDTAPSKPEEAAKPVEGESKVFDILQKVASQESGGKITEIATTEVENTQETVKPLLKFKMTESGLKDILRIKSESFRFTDIREILRGKSFAIYAYLCLLSGNAGVCKIKHLDLMKKLDISRPTLFKQGEWLIRLSLIEKRNVPGDHLGTSYTVHRLEEVLPVSEDLVRQLESQIESFRQQGII
jgi:hypothetical protein